MHCSFTHPYVRRNKASALFAKAFVLLLLLISSTASLFAHTVDYFSSCGYVCAGSNVTINARVSATISSTNYNWQFRDNSNSWKCFINGNNTINGVVFTVSGATAKGQLSNAPTLNIANAKTALEGVDLRLVMADGNNVSPCASNPSYPVWGTNKTMKLRVLSGEDCSDIAIYCAGGTPGTLKLGNLVWNDVNGNGVKDSNEPGVPNATVRLYKDANNDDAPDSNTPISTTITGSTGLYGFSKLNAGNYIVGVVIPAGYTRGPASSVNPGNNVDNDNNGVYLVGANQAGSEVRSKGITLSVGGEPTNDGDDSNGNQTLDIALCGNSQLGDFVWNDKNGNGIQEAGEPGIHGATVTITFPDGVTTASKTTDANGKYLFTTLAPGNYKVTFTTPSGFTNTSPSNVGSNDAIDSDPVSGSVTVSVSSGTSNLTVDAGFYVKVVISNLSLGNQVWNDYDGDGKRDQNEPAIGGATISLYYDNNGDSIPDGAAIKTTQSDVKGLYQFTNLTEGKYVVSMPILPGYQKSPNTSTQHTSPFPDNNVDDDNNLVRLVGPNGPGGILYSNTITLTAGDEPTNDGDGANGNNTLDLAQCGNGFIGDFVWNDLNGNGIQDVDNTGKRTEPGINGVEVTITFEDGTTATTTTLTYNANNNPNDPQFDGYYNFPNLGPGTYKITFPATVTLPGTSQVLNQSPANRGGDDTKDSDPVSGAPVIVTLVANQSDFTIDAGYTNATPPQAPCPNLSLGNMVFQDINGNGTKEAFEPGIGGLTVKLYSDNDGNNVADGAATSTLLTAADGTYFFGNLSAGKYIVGVATGDSLTQGTNGSVTPDDNKDNDNNGVRTANGEVQSNYITLSAGDEPVNDGSDNNSNFTLDFGLKIKAAPCTNHCDCKNDCTHTGCGHSNCGHGKCKNDCNHTDCGHSTCGHNNCKNDCDHKGCGHSNCGHNNCKNDCDHKGCGHSNCGHNSCKNDCDHKGCGHSNCGHNSCKNDCKHTKCDHKNCGHKSCKNDCKHSDCDDKNCGKYGNDGKSRSASKTAGEVKETGLITNTTMSVYPNPADKFFGIKVNSVKAGAAVVRVLDAGGKIVLSQNTKVTYGSNGINFNETSRLRSGMYTIQLLIDGQVFTQRLIIAK
ncbi:MAG: hypothetical protein JWQ40_4995 [Segetibacter sp.]|nr:hypothetical protein [Segetibacter sp.]